MNNEAAVALLRKPQTIRQRCHTILELAAQGNLAHFSYDPAKLDDVCDFVVKVTKEAYPDLKIPYHSRWSHFNVGGVNRIKTLDKVLAGLPKEDRIRSKFELAITSVLLDAGAGMSWKFREADSRQEFSKSEGLAVASFHSFLNGAFSADRKQPIADAKGLKAFSKEDLVAAFQVTKDNPLKGVEGRLALINALGAAVESNKEYFPGKSPRLGNLYDYLASRARNNQLEATIILDAVLKSLGSIWPGRIVVDGENLGDVWRHSSHKSNDSTSGLIPFHKLSQWLSYSLLEPLEESGLKVVGLNELTGLAEYRNGGLILDLELIKAKSPSALTQTFTPDSELIVEWRALTVATLDLIGEKVRQKLKLSPEEFPLVKVLQGGTWAAGRKIAAEKRADGGPPIQIQSDGTVF